MDTQKTLEAKNRLLLAVPYFRAAMKDAKAKGRTEVAILAAMSDGGKSIEMACDATELFDDIALVIGAPAQTKNDDMQAKAVGFLQRFGLKA